MSEAGFQVTIDAGQASSGGSAASFTFTATATTATGSTSPFTVTISNPGAGVWHNVGGVWKRVQWWHYRNPGGWTRVA